VTRPLVCALLLATLASPSFARTFAVPEQINDPLCALASTSCVEPPFVVIISAFPKELYPLLVRQQVAEMITIDDRRYFIGTLGRTSVVLVQGGIGLINAANTTRNAVANFEVSALLFSGVAGSRFNIADVIVPETWVDTAAEASFPVDPSLLDSARALAAGPPISFETCTPVPPEQSDAPQVCLPNAPVLRVGGVGQSADPFNGNASRCRPGTDPIFGCHPNTAATTDVVDDAVDMETAAVAHVATETGVPFLGFRGVSDGDGDPLGLPGFPAQFLAYYQIAADNSAATVIAFLEARATTTPPAPEIYESVRVQAGCRWPRTVSAACDPAQVPAKLSGPVTAACRLLARASLEETPTRAAKLERRARARWRRAAKLAKKSRRLAPECRDGLVTALGARAASSE
jgi:nucleoside phosphorylase